MKKIKLNINNLKKLVFTCIMLLILNCLSVNKSYAFLEPDDPIKKDSYSKFAKCMNPALSQYLTAILNAQQSGLIGNQAQILSPAFNMTSDTFGSIYNEIAPALNHPNLAGIAGNIYNTSATNTLSYYVENQELANLGHPIYITESGVGPDNHTGTNQQVTDEIANVFNNYPGLINAVALFNPTNSNPSFPHHNWTHDELTNLCNTVGNCGNIGINYGTYFGGNDYDEANQYGMGFVVQIADENTNLQELANSINSFNGNVIIRIGTLEGAGAFENVSEYINFLSDLTNLLDAMGSNANFFAIGGPNEPDLEHWLNPACAEYLLAWGICNLEPNQMPVNYRTEVIGHNGSKPWFILSNITDKVSSSDGEDLDNLVSGLQADFIITVPKYLHDDFEIITDQGIGATEANSDTGYAKRIDKRIFNLPLFNTAMPGTKLPASYGVYQEFAYNPLKKPETHKQYLDRILKKTNGTKDGEEFGKPAEMPNIVIKACLQRANCDPRREKCLRAIPNPTDPYCGENDSPNECVGLGKTFNMTGHISQEEPTDLNAISRAYGLITDMFVDQTTAPLSYNRLYTPQDLASAVAYSTQDVRYENPLAIDNSRDQNQMKSSNDARVDKNELKNNQIVSTPVYAATSDMAQPTGAITVNTTTNDDGSVSIFYNACIWAQPGSACNIRDVNAVINGKEIFTMASARILGEGPGNAYCFQPGWGDAPEINATLGPGQCTVVSVFARGGRVGPEGCVDNVSLNCQVCKSATGEISQDCGYVPPPPPVDCRECTSWAPAQVCTPINAQKIINEKECSNGNCNTKKTKLESDLQWEVNGDYDGYQLNYQAQQNANTPWYQQLMGIVDEFLGLVGMTCDIDTQQDWVDTNGDGQLEQIEVVTGATCRYGAKDYFLYAWPMSYEGDYKEKSVDMGLHNAMFRMNGKNDQYFIPKSTTQPITMKLSITNPEAIGGRDLEYKIPQGNQAWDLLDWFPNDVDSYYIGIRGQNTRVMYLEYFEFFQPQISGYCLKQRSLSMPITDRNVPEADNPLCGYLNFWNTGITYDLYHDRNLAKQREPKGSPALAYNQQINSGTQLIASSNLQEIDSDAIKIPLQSQIDIDNQLSPIVTQLAREDLLTRYQKSKKLQNISVSDLEILIENFYSEYANIFKKYSAKYSVEALNDSTMWPDDFAQEINNLSKKYLVKYSLI